MHSSAIGNQQRTPRFRVLKAQLASHEGSRADASLGNELHSLSWVLNGSNFDQIAIGPPKDAEKPYFALNERTQTTLGIADDFDVLDGRVS